MMGFGMNEKEKRKMLEYNLKQVADDYPYAYASFLTSEIAIDNTCDYAYITLNPKTFSNFVIHINFDNCINLPPQHLAYIILHEVIHYYNNHFERLKPIMKENMKLANIVGDLEINSMLGYIDLPILFPKLFNLPEFRTAEYYYLALKQSSEKGKGKSQDEESEGQETDEQKGQGTKEKEGQEGQGIDEQEGQGIDEQEGQGTKEKEGQKGKKQPKRRTVETDNDFKKMVEEYEKLPNNVKDNIKKIIDHIMDDVKEITDYLSKGKEQGTDKGDITTTASIILEKKYEWEYLIKMFPTLIKMATKFTYRRPPRRQQSDVILPYKYKERKPNIALFFDNSGSIDIQVLYRIFGSITPLLYEANISNAFTFDTDIYPIENFTYYLKTKKPFEIQGRGGTDTNPIFKYLSTHKDINGAIIFTDGYADFPEIDDYPPILTLWIVIDKEGLSIVKKNIPKHHKAVLLEF